MPLDPRKCIICQKEYNPVRVWQKFCSAVCAFKANLGRIRLSQKKYCIENPEKRKESLKKYLEKNKDKIIERARNKRWVDKKTIFKWNRYCSLEELQAKAEHHVRKRKQWYLDNKEHCYRKSRNRELIRSFGMTLEQYEKMEELQEGKCQICGTHYSTNNQKLAVDHCHNTKKVRGLLCKRCNQGIGLFEEDIETLKMAIIYLNKYAYSTEFIGYPGKNATDGQPVQRLSDTPC